VARDIALPRRVFLAVYAASGAAALVYEVAWTRLLTLDMGHTVAAASTVLAAFMGGLALGAALAGSLVGPGPRTSGERRRLLRVYAGLEVVVALTAMLLPWLLNASMFALAWAYADGGAPLRFGLVRLAVSLAALGLPAAAMGATFPVAAAALADAQPPLASDRRVASVDAAAGAGALYAANTAGAAAGAIAAGFWLIPSLGLRATTWVGVVLNIAAAAGSMWIGTTMVETEMTQPAESSTSRVPKARDRRRQQPAASAMPRSPQPSLAAAAAAASGFVALVYEVAWTRLLALVIGPTTYAFATMVGVFVSGLAIGAAVGTRIVRRTRRADAWLGAMLLVTAAAAPAAAWFTATRLPLLVASQVVSPSAAFGRIVGQQAAIVALLLLPMTFALGAAFPLALGVASPTGAAVGREAARVYAANTVGAIGGALAGGFVLLPALGLQSTFRVAAIVGVMAAGAVWLAARPAAPKPHGGQGGRSGDVGKRRSREGAFQLGAVVGALALIVSLPAWDRELLASGAYKYAPYMNAGDFEITLRAGTLEYYREGAASTVSVHRLGGTRSMAIDGKVDASDGGDMLTQRLLGLLPALLHRDPRDLCVIGLGSGVTVAAALSTGTIQRADVVEISPQVVEASALFARENDNVLGKPAVRLVVGDGRSHLLLTRRRYDVIVSEPSNPWMAGVASLFTREFFEAARARLQPDGILCQWAHTYDITDADLRSIVRTFASVFPQGTLWLAGDGDLLLIGTNGESIETRLGGVGQYAQRGRAAAIVDELTMPIRVGGSGSVSFSSPMFELMSLYAGGPRELADYGGGARVQTDDRTALEFSAPRAIYGRSVNDNTTRVRALLDGRTPPIAVRVVLAQAGDRSWAARGSMNLKAEAFTAAYDDFLRALTLNSRSAGALAGLSMAAAGARRQADERAWLEARAAAEQDNAPVRIELSHVRAAEGDLQGAIAAATEATRLAPADPLAAEQLASVLADAGDAARLASVAEELLAKYPGRAEPLYYHASALFMTGRAEEAAAEIRQLVARDPRHARAQNLLGAACATLGQHECAAAAFRAALDADPRDASTYVNVGLFRLQSADPASASEYFAEALALDPASAAARNGLAQARAASKVP